MADLVYDELRNLCFEIALKGQEEKHNIELVADDIFHIKYIYEKDRIIIKFIGTKKKLVLDDIQNKIKGAGQWKKDVEDLLSELFDCEIIFTPEDEENGNDDIKKIAELKKILKYHTKNKKKV